MSIEMADHNDFDHTGMQEIANAVRDVNSGSDGLGGGTTQKRKREVSDQDGSPDATRRSASKRVSPNTKGNLNMNETNDPSATSFMDAQQDSDAVEALQDYSSLHDQNSSEIQNGSTDHANATSTAAAALGIYPTMTIPQPTDVSFATQGSGDQNQDSFMDNSQQDNSFMDNSAPNTGGRSGGSKPAVGSEEWHKVRKDNHKEGMSVESAILSTILTSLSRASSP
jgi:hypothetical protein